MNATNTATEPRFTGTWPEFLDALDRIYRIIGLTDDDARAATFADAEFFVPGPAQPEFAA